jgi:hypothetical protein
MNRMNRTHSRGYGLGRIASASPDALVLWTVTQATTLHPPLVVAESKPFRVSQAGASESNELQKPYRSSIELRLSQAIERHLAPARLAAPWALPSANFIAVFPKDFDSPLQGCLRQYEARGSARIACAKHSRLPQPLPRALDLRP